MTKDDIINWAREAGGSFEELPLCDAWLFYEEEYLERFAALVAAAAKEEMLMAGNDQWLEEARKAGAKAEQDRCCGLIFSWAGSDNVAQRTVDAIRGKV
jgi:hypothetical protein